MTMLHIARTFRSRGIAICGLVALLCASCATGARNEGDAKSPEELARLYISLGTQALQRGDLPQAVEDLRKGLVADPKNAEGHNNLALAYYGLGKKELARRELERATEINPAFSDAYVNLGMFSLESGDLARARYYYNKALENLEYKTRHRALTNLAQIALQENNTEEARRLLYQSLQANPDYCMSHFLLGTIFSRESNAARAADEFKKSVVSTCASNVEGHFQLGLAYLKQRDFPKARTQFVFLIEKYPQTLQAQKAGEQLRYIP